MPDKCNDEAINAFSSVKNDAIGSITQAGIQNMLPDNYNNKMQNIAKFLLTSDQQENANRNLSEWSTKYYGLTRKFIPDIKENMENIKDMDNKNIIKNLGNINNISTSSNNNDTILKENNKLLANVDFVNDAIKARHQAFFGLKNFDVECGNNADITIQDFIKKEQNDIEQLNLYMKSFLDSYQSIFKYKSSLTAIFFDRLDEIKKIKEKINVYNQNLFMDNRKDKGENKKIGFYDNIKLYITIIFYLLAAFYAYKLFFNKQDINIDSNSNSNKTYIKLLKILFVLCIPLLVYYLVWGLHFAYVYYLEYYNIKKDVISYPYILNKYEIANY